METKGNSGKMIKASKSGREIPVIQNSCIFTSYDAELLMDETEKLRELITKRGTLEILIPLCCTTDPVRYIIALPNLFFEILFLELESNILQDHFQSNSNYPVLEYRNCHINEMYRLGSFLDPSYLINHAYIACVDFK